MGLEFFAELYMWTGEGTGFFTKFTRGGSPGPLAPPSLENPLIYGGAKTPKTILKIRSAASCSGNSKIVLIIIKLFVLQILNHGTIISRVYLYRGA